MGFENVGEVWTQWSIKSYLDTIEPPAWCDSITLHHTGIPSLEQRPVGFQPNHLRNMQHYYEVTNNWPSAPHLFIDEDQGWGMCDFRVKGVHAGSFNARSIGIEVLGNYDVETPFAGRGLRCWKTAAIFSRALLDWMGLEPSVQTVLFHRDEPNAGKNCPGLKVEKPWILGLIDQAYVPDGFYRVGPRGGPYMVA